jgi:hypothetical protein
MLVLVTVVAEDMVIDRMEIDRSKMRTGVSFYLNWGAGDPRAFSLLVITVGDVE